MAIDSVPSWDIVLKDYIAANANKNTNHRKESRIDVRLDARQQSVCDRLFSDYIKRNEKKQQAEERNRIEREARPKECAVIHPLRQYEIQKLYKEECQLLNEAMKQFRAAEAERNSIMRYSSTRKGAPYDNKKIEVELKEALEQIGDPIKNEAAIKVLLHSSTRKRVISLIEKIETAVDEQARVAAEYHAIDDLEKAEVEILKQKMIEFADGEILKILKEEDLPHLGEVSSNGQRQWLSEESIRDDILELMKARISAPELFSEFMWYRRGIRSYTDRLLMEAIVKVITVDYHLRRAFNDAWIEPMLISAYDYTLVDHIKNSQRYKYIGTTSGLKYRSQLKHELEELINVVVDHFKMLYG